MPEQRAGRAGTQHTAQRPCTAATQRALTSAPQVLVNSRLGRQLWVGGISRLQLDCDALVRDHVRALVHLPERALIDLPPQPEPPPNQQVHPSLQLFRRGGKICSGTAARRAKWASGAWRTNLPGSWTARRALRRRQARANQEARHWSRRNGCFFAKIFGRSLLQTGTLDTSSRVVCAVAAGLRRRTLRRLRGALGHRARKQRAPKQPSHSRVRLSWSTREAVDSCAYCIPQSGKHAACAPSGRSQQTVRAHVLGMLRAHAGMLGLHALLRCSG